VGTSPAKFRGLSWLVRAFTKPAPVVGEKRIGVLNGAAPAYETEEGATAARRAPLFAGRCATLDALAGKDKELINIRFSLHAVTGREPLAIPCFVAEMSQEDQKRPGFH
jgi:hypothetical protein